MSIKNDIDVIIYLGKNYSHTNVRFWRQKTIPALKELNKL